MRRAIWSTLIALALVGPLAASAFAQGTVPREVANRYGLTRAWFAQVGSPQVTGLLEYVQYDHGMLLAQSRGGLVTALDAETGRTLWSLRIGSRDGGSSQPAANENYVVVLNGSTLYVIDRKDGGIVWQKRVARAPGAGPAVTATHAFVPMLSGLVEGYDLAAGDKQTPWNFQSTGRVLNPPLATPLTVSWTTEHGHFYVADPTAAGIKYRLETQGKIAGRPASWSPRLFAASDDGFVFGIDETKGTISWKRSIGEPILQGPVAVTDRVFVIPEFGGMRCLAADSGAPLWIAPGIEQFVAASPTRVYAVDNLGRLAILDGASGGLIGTVPVSARTAKLVNIANDRIYLVDENCLVQCLHETQLSVPVPHTPPAVEERELKLTPKKPAADAAEEPAEEMPSEEPAADDDANPFDVGDDAGSADDAPAEEDPFGNP
jgi:outer membrane protein assembly factor BamB